MRSPRNDAGDDFLGTGELSETAVGLQTALGASEWLPEYTRTAGQSPVFPHFETGCGSVCECALPSTALKGVRFVWHPILSCARNRWRSFSLYSVLIFVFVPFAAFPSTLLIERSLTYSFLRSHAVWRFDHVCAVCMALIPGRVKRFQSSNKSFGFIYVIT